MSPSEQVLRRLELTIRRRLDGLLHGQHQGLLPGPGSEAGEARRYEPGDDVRRMDWAVTARTGEPYVRMPIAERELEAWLLLDLSASVAFGTADREKRDLVLSAAAAVGFLTAGGGNRIGAVLASGGGTVTVPSRPGDDAFRALLHRATTLPVPDGAGPGDLAGALRRVGRLARRRGLVVVVSDFLAPAGWERPLRVLGARHEVLAVEVVDPRELELPAVGVLNVVDPETGRTREVPTNRRTRERYAAAAAEQRRRTADELRRAGVGHLQLRTDRDWVLDVARFVQARRAMAAVR